jgi:RHS repeat-associated protein
MRYLTGKGLDQLYARYDGTNTAFYVGDNLGSVRLLVNVSGTVLDQLTYNSYGNILTETNAANGDRFKYTSREWNGEIGLQYNRLRYYTPSDGRWVTQDIVGFAAGDRNLYRYVANISTSRVDPSGNYYRIVSVNENDRRIVVGLDIGFLGMRSNSTAVRWANAIKKYWDGPGYSSYVLKGPWTLQVDVSWQIVQSYWGSPFNNNITIVPNSPPSYRSYVTPSRGLFQDWYGDTGVWGDNEDDWSIAHEAGHLFGFGDYYNDVITPAGLKSIPWKGYEGTIMAQTGGTADQPTVDGRSFRDMLIDAVLLRTIPVQPAYSSDTPHCVGIQIEDE